MIYVLKSYKVKIGSETIRKKKKHEKFKVLRLHIFLIKVFLFLKLFLYTLKISKHKVEKS